MELKNIFTNLFKNEVKTEKQTIERFICTDFPLLLDKNTAYFELCVAMCINKIANSISLCKFDTYKAGKEEKGDIWYRLNVEPSKNQNARCFYSKMIFQAVTNREGALIIQNVDGDLLVADSFYVEKYANYQNIYKNVVVDNYEFARTFKEEDVLRIQLNNNNIKLLLKTVYNMYNKMLQVSVKNYNRQFAKKLIVKIDSTFDQFKRNVVDEETGETEYDLLLDDIFKNRLKGYFSEADSATPVESGLTLEDVSKEFSSGAKYRASDDVRAINEDVQDLVADAFNIPRGLLQGNVADAEVLTENFVTFCIAPIIQQIEDEVNRKLYKKDNVIKGTRLRIKTYTINTQNLNKLANTAEALYRISAVNPNFIRELMNEEEIQEDFANHYAITKNYEIQK